MLTWWRSPRCVELIIPIAAARLITEARLSAPGAAATAMQSDCRGREVSLRRLPPPDWWLPGLTEPADIYRLYEYLRGAEPTIKDMEEGEAAVDARRASYVMALHRLRQHWRRAVRRLPADNQPAAFERLRSAWIGQLGAPPDFDFELEDFFRRSLISVADADDPPAAVRELFSGRRRPGPKGKRVEDRDIKYAMKVAELRASGMRSIDAACEKVAGGDKRLFESVKRAYYRHRLAARAELEMRRLNQAKGGIEIRWSESSGASVSISSVGQIAEAEARRDAGFRPSRSAVTGGPAYPIIGDRKARRTSEKTAISMQNLINVLAKQRAKGSPQQIPSWAYKQLSVEQIEAVKEGDIEVRRRLAMEPGECLDK
jgi:hypothetical protein